MTVTSETAERAALYAGSQQSSAVAVWQRGELLVDKHWPVAGDGAYGAMQLGETDDGEPLEDVASIQKSIVSVLVGMAVRQELLTVTDPVHLWLGKGWSQASAAQEQSITLHHLLSMTSGLSTELTFEVPAGSRWAYNTNVYSRLVPVLERASGTDIGPLSQTWLIGPAGMTHTSWYERAFAGKGQDANRLGISTTARDLIRFGEWMLGTVAEPHDSTLDADYLQASLCASQHYNPGYGYLWWLNGQKVVSPYGIESEQLVASAPADMFAAEGALGRRLYLVPSQSLLIARLGNTPPDPAFEANFWDLLMGHRQSF